MPAAAYTGADDLLPNSGSADNSGQSDETGNALSVTIERIVPAAILATRREEEFRTVHVTFSEILQRVGPQHLGGPLPPIRDDLYTTEGNVEEEPASTADLDSEWNEETQKG